MSIRDTSAQDRPVHTVPAVAASARRRRVLSIAVGAIASTATPRATSRTIIC